MHSQFKANKTKAKNAREQKKFDLFILFLTALLWLYIINNFAIALIK